MISYDIGLEWSETNDIGLEWSETNDIGLKWGETNNTRLKWGKTNDTVSGFFFAVSAGDSTNGGASQGATNWVGPNHGR
jgi:hypothetical protein